MARKSEPLRQRVPERTCTKTYKSYRSFKKDLRKDFNRRCGYCDDHDDGFWRGFQIDHFIPQTQLQNIQDNDYGNLVYSCFFCNNSKGQDWPSNDELVAVTPARHGYIDPCSNQYDAQYHRDKDGKIIADSEVGEYMHCKLKLWLERHRIKWWLNKLEEQIDILKKNKKNLNANLGKRLNRLLEKHYAYQEYLKNENEQ